MTAKIKDQKKENLEAAMKKYKKEVSSFQDFYNGIHEIIGLFLDPLPPEVARVILRTQDERISKREYANQPMALFPLDNNHSTSKELEELMLKIMKQTTEMYEKAGYKGKLKTPVKVSVPEDITSPPDRDPQLHFWVHGLCKECGALVDADKKNIDAKCPGGNAQDMMKMDTF